MHIMRTRLAEDSPSPLISRRSFALSTLAIAHPPEPRPDIDAELFQRGANLDHLDVISFISG